MDALTVGVDSLRLRNFDAVAFDLEGTLANTIPTHRAARMRAFVEHGYGHISREEHERGPLYGSSTFDIIGGVLHAAGEIADGIPFKDHFAVQQLAATKARLFEELSLDGFSEMPGAVAFGRDILAHFPGKAALVTTALKGVAAAFLNRYGLLQYFPAHLVITEETVIAKGLENKPAPDPYCLAMRRMRSHKLLVFEDTVPGVASAKRAGATVIALGFDQHNAEQFLSGMLQLPPDAFAPDYRAARELLDL